MNTIKLTDLNPGTMFYKPMGTHRYIKTDIANDEGVFIYNLTSGKSYYNRGSTQVIELDIMGNEVISEPICKTPAKVPDPWCMCYVEGGDIPRMKHSYSVAKAEAERLAKLTGKRVFILIATEYVNHEEPVKSEFHWRTTGRR